MAKLWEYSRCTAREKKNRRCQYHEYRYKYSEYQPMSIRHADLRVLVNIIILPDVRKKHLEGPFEEVSMAISCGL